MTTIVRSMFAIAVVVCLASFAFGEHSTATYYTTYTPSSCYGYQDQGVMIAAARADIFNSRAACGRHYTIKCTGLGYPGDWIHPCNGNSVRVKVVDLCPGCKGAFDLSEQAFSAIANTAAGKLKHDTYLERLNQETEIR
ncbi:EG45-like domain containing protein-like protein [Drosera capensis]